MWLPVVGRGIPGEIKNREVAVKGVRNGRIMDKFLWIHHDFMTDWV